MGTNEFWQLGKNVCDWYGANRGA